MLRIRAVLGSWLILCVCSGGLLWGAEDWAAASPPSAQVVSGVHMAGLQPLDWVIVAVYAAATIWMGWYCSRTQNTTQEYFVGSGRMNPFLVGVSLFATLLSTITYRSVPGEMIAKGPMQLATIIALPLVYLIVGYWLIPIYMRQRVTSAYELLEERLGLEIRLLGATLFLILRLVWMSLLVYLTAEAMVVMMGVGEQWIPVVAFATGIVAVIYTSMGGLRAVMITDFVQTVLLMGGAVLVIATVTYQFGGFDWVPTSWQKHWDDQPLYSFNPRTRISLMGSIVTMLIWYTCTAGGDQTSVQRFMATTDAKAARRAFATQMSCSALITVLLCLVGFALMGYFNRFAETLPAGMGLTEDADDLFPRYIAFHLPVGVSGLVVAALFAAAMSSIDSGVNSITAVVMTDFFGRFGKGPKTEKGQVRAAQLLALTIGGIAVFCSSFMGQVPGNITEMTNKTTNLLVTPIFGLFFFALFVPFASRVGVILGMFCGTLTAVLIAFSGPIFDPCFVSKVDPDPISFQWIAPCALSVNLLTGMLFSRCFPDSRPAAAPAVEES